MRQIIFANVKATNVRIGNLLFLFYFTLTGASNVQYLFCESYFFKERLGVNKNTAGNEVFSGISQ